MKRLFSAIIIFLLLSAFNLCLASCKGNKGINKMNDKSELYLKPAVEQLEKTLTTEQFKITQQCGTEPQFNKGKQEGSALDTRQRMKRKS